MRQKLPGLVESGVDVTTFDELSLSLLMITCGRILMEETDTPLRPACQWCPISSHLPTSIYLLTQNLFSPTSPLPPAVMTAPSITASALLIALQNRLLKSSHSSKWKTNQNGIFIYALYLPAIHHILFLLVR